MSVGQVIGIRIGTNCAPLLAGLFLKSNKSEYLDNMIRYGYSHLLGHSICVVDTQMS